MVLTFNLNLKEFSGGWERGAIGVESRRALINTYPVNIYFLFIFETLPIELRSPP